ncbi:MAG: coproporphyrinogen III oxidase-like Fe-S oxidoreductase, partial [Roseivirga sp.]
MIDAICMELDLQVDYFNQDQVNTIYFGGGT